MNFSQKNNVWFCSNIEKKEIGKLFANKKLSGKIKFTNKDMLSFKEIKGI